MFFVFFILCFLTCSVHSTESEFDIQTEMFKQSLQMTRTYGISDSYIECISTWEHLINTTDLLLLQLFDASAKLQSGVTELNLYNLGSFDMCYDLESNINKKTVYGKYCLTEDIIVLSSKSDRASHNQIIQIPNANFKQFAVRSIPESTNITFRNAICVPSVCSAEDMNVILTGFLDIANISATVKFDTAKCFSKDTRPELTTGANLTIALLAIVVSLVLCSSAYDYYLRFNDKKPAHEVLLAFSAITNGEKIFTSSKNPEQLLCLNGIRAMSMAWVFLGHEYATIQGGPIENFVQLLKTTTDGRHMWLLASFLSVDSFFAAGGIVTVYTYLKSRSKGVPFNIPLYYIHRYLRLTPALAVVLLIQINLIKYLGNGPLWNMHDDGAEACQKYWWSVLLYIQNYVNPNENCIGQSWYLSVDFQLFLCSPIVLYLLTKLPKLGYSLLGLLVFLGFLDPFLITYYYEIDGFPFSGDQSAVHTFNQQYYIQPYTRLGPYVIGMVFGALIYHMKVNNKIPRKTQRNRIIALGLWIVALCGLVGSLYCGAIILHERTQVESSFYHAFHRNTWGISVGLVVLLCVSGFGGPIDTFLSAPIFQFVTKLSYCIYLVHGLFLVARTAASRSTLRFSHLWIMHIFWADFMIVLFLAFALCVCFESPIITLEKFIFSPFTKQAGQRKEKAKHEG